MLTSRIVSLKIGSKTIHRQVKRCTPQGGVISSLLWLLVVDGLLRRLENKGVTTVGYAVDIVVMARGLDPSTLSGLIQSAFKTVIDWTLLNGLGVNAAKTELVLFTKKSIPKFTLPKLNGVEIQRSDFAKYLGVVLDRN